MTRLLNISVLMLVLCCQSWGQISAGSIQAGGETSAELQTTVADSQELSSPTSQNSDTNRFSLNDLEVQAPTSTRSVWVVLPLSFLAGFLLNFMPCVLPVVGLKLLSFIQQAQSDRRRILLMNLSYTAGLLSVMLVLASLAVFTGLGWGEQFSSTGFTITLAAVVFAFGLSFLGVWDIPLPGFVSTADGKGPSEGYAGAFSKGILSTILATPCSGPFLGAALAWAVTQPAVMTFAVFVTVGLGMASPYLVIGAFPSLIRVLPKPGNWMITFKYIMGFVMLGTVVYLLSFVAIASVVPTVLLLLGIGIAVWFAGQTPFTAKKSARLRAWGIAIAIVLLTTSVSFGWFEKVMQDRFERAAARFAAQQSPPNAVAEPTIAMTQITEPNTDVVLDDASKNEISTNQTAIQPQAESQAPAVIDDGIAWQIYSPDILESAIASGRPVFVDFTADWCLTCKANEAAAIDTTDVSRALRKHNIVALLADKTSPNPEADALLRKLGNKAASIPFYAFFNPETPDKPIVLDGIIASPQPFVDAAARSAID